VAIRATTVDANGLRFDALTSGPAGGELVLLLHGFPQSAACWSSALTAIGAAGFRAVAVSQRGYSDGALPESVDAYHMRELRADVLAIADALGYASFHLVGHDWGGIVAWSLAAERPERISTLTVAAASHPAAVSEALRHTEQRLRMSYVALLRAPMIPEALFNVAGGALAVRALMATGLERARAERDVSALRRRGATGALNWYRATDRDTLAVGEVRVPTLHVWADSDPVFARGTTERSAAFVDAPYHLLELQGATHWIPDQHWEDVEDILLGHLSDHASTAVRTRRRPARRAKT